MIKSINIQNFLSHRNSTLEFHPGVNIITGKSEHGKSVIMRAIRWVITNKPSGDSIRSWWNGDTEVSIITKEGIVKRTKGTTNSYQLNDTVLTGFGQDVPNQIAQLLNMDDINIQTQFEEHFLLSDTAGEVALFFNKIAHLDVIDRGTKNIKKWIKDLDHSISVNKTIIKKTEDQIEELKYLHKMEIDIEVLEEKQEKLQKLYQKSTALKKQIENIVKIDEEIAKLKNITMHEVLLSRLLKKHKTLTELIDKKETLKELISKLKTTTRQLTELKKLSICESQVNNLLNLYKQQKDLTTKHTNLSTLLSKIKNITSTIAKTKKITEAEQDVLFLLQQSTQLQNMSEKKEQLELIIEALKNIEQKLVLKKKELNSLEITFQKEFPDICPLCGTNCTNHNDNTTSNTKSKK